MGSKLISGDSLAATRWNAPGVESDFDHEEPDQGGGAQPSSLLTAEQLEQIHQQAWEEGFAKGQRDGLDLARREIDAQVANLAAVADALTRPYDHLDEQVEAEFVAVIKAIVRHVVRRELRIQPDEVVAVVRRALEAMPSAARGVTLFLQPQDAELVRESLPGLETEHGWRIVEDSSLSRGGCRVESESSLIDATVEHRLNSAIAAALGGERRGDADDAD